MKVKDASGKLMGEIKDQGLKEAAFDAHGRKVGEYIKAENVTRDAHGRRVGQGNLLAHLL